jgi:SAM-dependent methyltransferase
VGEHTSAEAEVERIMVRIRAELAQRAPGRAMLDGTSPSSPILTRTVEALSHSVSLRPTRDLPVPAPIQLALSEPDGIVSPTAFRPTTGARYRLKDLSDYHDRDFICAAYSAVFQREPDEKGLNTYLGLLRGGASKTEILEFLRDSPEGQSAQVPVAGLSFRLRILKIFRWRPLRPIGRIAAALWYLPEAHQRQRVLEGRLVTLIEHNQARATEAIRSVHHALRDLESANHNLTLYATSKLGNEAGRDIEASIASANNSVYELRGLLDNKANAEDMRRTSGEVSDVRESLLRSLKTKVERPELNALASTLHNSLGEVCSTLRSEKAVRAELANDIALLRSEDINEMRELLTRSLETKAARPELEVLASTTQNLLGEFSGELRTLKLERNEFAKQIAEMRSEAIRFASFIDKAAADTTGFNEIGRLLTHSLETKVGYSELKALASATQSSLDEISGQLRNLIAERRELEKQIAEQSSAEISRLDEARALLTDSLKQKAEHSELETLTKHILDLVQARATKEDIAEIKAGLEVTLNGAVDLISQLSQSKVDRVSTEADKGEMQKMLEAVRTQAAGELQGALAGVDARTRDIKLNLLDQERRLALLLEEARKRLPEPISSDQIEAMLVEENHVMDAMYAEFEDIFRGTRADISKRQAIYIPLVREAGAGQISSPVVDLGCGRGEWLELLREAGLRAQGVDTNRIFLERCRALSLEVIESDAVAFLRNAKRNSLGAITSFHLIEHLPHKILIAMLDAALQALRPGGVVILETPNPRNLQVASCNFYMDPTHRHPLPPDLMQYVMEARGFVNVSIRELHPYSEDNLVTDGSVTINKVLNRFLFSSQDYAVIGKKA